MCIEQVTHIVVMFFHYGFIEPNGFLIFVFLLKEIEKYDLVHAVSWGWGEGEGGCGSTSDNQCISNTKHGIRNSRIRKSSHCLEFGKVRQSHFGIKLETCCNNLLLCLQDIEWMTLTLVQSYLTVDQRIILRVLPA